MNKLFFLLIILLSLSCKKNTDIVDFKLQQGDLLFQDTGNDSISQAIKSVTKKEINLNFSHVGIVVKKGHELFVLEAVSKGVSATPLASFLMRSVSADGNPLVVVGRIVSKYKNCIPAALDFGKQQVGKEYDSAFLFNNNRYYCSELIYDMFQKAGINEIFQVKPMTFKDSFGDDFNKTWIEYYKKLDMAIPEGQLGINPNGMPCSQTVRLIYDYSIAKKMLE